MATTTTTTTTTVCEPYIMVVSTTTDPREFYRELRSLGWTASDAIWSARIRAAFAAQEGTRVRLRLVPDADWRYHFECSCDDVARCTDRNCERAEREGVWGIVGEYRDPFTGEWEHADSVFGFIGDDWRNSVYDDDVREAALTEARILYPTMP